MKDEIRNMQYERNITDVIDESARRNANLLDVRLSEEMPLEIKEIKLKNLIDTEEVVTNYITEANRLIVSENTIPSPYDLASQSNTEDAFAL